MEGTAKSVSMARLEQVLPAAYDNYQLLVPAMELMLQYRIETVSQLNRIADELDKRHRQGNIAKIVGSSAAVIGSVTALAGVALTPFAAGPGALLIVGGTGVATVGTGTAATSHVMEKVFEKVDLEKLQQAVDRDRRQCEEVHKLWKEFDSYCVDVINTIALADPSEESDIASLQTWVQVALEEVKHPVILIAETFSGHKPENGVISDCIGPQLLLELGERARTFLKHPFVKKVLSSAVSKLKTAVGTVAFLTIAAIGIGNLFVIFITAIDIHKGSLSKVAKELREKSHLLQQELDKWLDAFGYQ